MKCWGQSFLTTAVLSCTLLFSACSGAAPNADREAQSFYSEEHQVKNQANGEISTFGLNIAPAGEMGDWVAAWISEASAGNGFQYFVYTDPDSWDVYLYYPTMQTKLPMLTNADITVDVSDSVLRVYVTDNVEANALREDTHDWILHFAAYPLGTWPSSIELYWNDVEIECDATK